MSFGGGQGESVGMTANPAYDPDDAFLSAPKAPASAWHAEAPSLLYGVQQIPTYDVALGSTAGAQRAASCERASPSEGSSGGHDHYSHLSGAASSDSTLKGGGLTYATLNADASQKLPGDTYATLDTASVASAQEPRQSGGPHYGRLQREATDHASKYMVLGGRQMPSATYASLSRGQRAESVYEA